MRKRLIHSLLTTAAMLAPTAAITLVTLAVPAPARAQANPAIGTWSGKLAVGGAGLTLVFHIAADSAGGLTGTMDSPDQGATGIAIDEVKFESDTLTLRITRLGVEYVATLSGNRMKLEGTFRQAGMALPLSLDKGEAAAREPRPQEPVGPVPYDVREVTFRNDEAGIELAGTLTLPRSAGPVPAAVLVTGSGAQDRDESIMNHKPFLVLADHLTRNGIAVLRYDDRGVGGSGGSMAMATTMDFAGDALSAVHYLQSVSGIAAGSVGIIGHSEGGLIAPAAAARSDDVAWIVMLAGPGVPGKEILNEQIAKISRASGLSEPQIAMSLRTQDRIYDILEQDGDDATMHERLRTVLTAALDSMPAAQRAAVAGTKEQADTYVGAQIRQVTSPWFRFFLTYDPRPALERVHVPVLAINGSLDLQVPPDQNLPEIKAALERGGDTDVTVRELPGLNHLFQTARTGAPAEYATIDETFSPAALDLISSWITARFAR